MVHPVPPRHALGAALTIAVLVLGPRPAFAQCPDGTPPPCEVAARQAVARATAPRSQAERGRRLLVLPFRNLARSAEHEWLVEGSPSLLADALGHWQDLYIVPPERLFPALRRHGLIPGAVLDEARIRRVAEETRGWTAVTGEILATGNRLRISLRAYDVTTGQVVTRAAEEVAAADDVREAYTRLGRHLLRAAGLDATADPGGAPTTSLEAYRAYLRGQAHYNRAELAQARAAFEEAVRLDTAFARAWMKLAEASLTSVEAFVNPQSAAYRHAARASALAQQLPPRDRDLVQSFGELLAGQLGAARERLTRLIRDDSNHVEALERLSGLEQMDPVLVGSGASERPRGSLNESVRLSKRVISLDPTRHGEYQTLLSPYVAAAGRGYGRVVGIRGERPSLVATLQAMNGADRLWTVVLRDSLVLIPVESLAQVPPDSLARWRADARAVAAAWVERWLAAAPNLGMAHLNAAEVAVLSGDVDRALRHIARAESLGIEYETLSNFNGRRIEYLVRAGRLTEATRIADAELAGDRWRGATFVGSLPPQQDAAWGFTAYLLAGRPAAAESLAVRLRDASVAAAGLPLAQAQTGVLCFFMCRGDIAAPLFPEMPDAVRRTALDSLLGAVDRLPRDAMLVQSFQVAAGGPWRNAGRLDSARVAAYLRRGVGWVRAGRTDLAISLAIGLAQADSTTATQRAIHEGVRAMSAAAPQEPALRYQIGRFAAVTGLHLEEAEQALNGYLAAPAPAGAPSHPAAYWRLGQIYEHMGRPDRARQAWERALQLDPTMTGARQGLDRLGPPGN